MDNRFTLNESKEMGLLSEGVGDDIIKAVKRSKFDVGLITKGINDLLPDNLKFSSLSCISPLLNPSSITAMLLIGVFCIIFIDTSILVEKVMDRLN